MAEVQPSTRQLSRLISHLYNALVRLRRFLQPVPLLFILAVAARVIPGPRTVDDAYITFRYAQNLLSGHGLVYNPGEAVLGTTTPVYALLMVGLGLVTGGSQAPFPILSLIVNALADGLTCWFLFKLGEALGHRRVGLAAAVVWAIAPWSVTFAIGGMETSVFVMLLMATFYFHSNDKPVAAAVMASLSILTRPDALIAVLPMIVERIRQSIKKHRQQLPIPPITAREVSIFCLPLLGWILFGTFFYGNPIPNSLLAKVAAYHLPREAGFIRLLQHYATPFLGHLTFGTWWIGAGLLLYPILYSLGTLMILRRRLRLWPLFIYPWVYLIVFSVANPLIFRWYLTPPLPILFLGILLGIERISRDARTPLPSILAPVAFVLLTLGGWILRPDHGPTRPAPKMAYIQLELLYEVVAEELRDKIIPTKTLAAGDIGALGYYSGAHILDTIGLISPQSIPYYPIPESYYAINYAVPPDLITNLKPDYLVVLEAYGRNALLLDAEFNRKYRLLKEIPTDIYGSEGMLIFELQSE
jgi:hypothetical protein